MPRHSRKIIQGVTYHCFSRCHGKKNLHKSSFGKHIFIDAVNMCHEKYNFELIAAETVGNHIHILIKTVEGSETISRIMQYIKARIAEKYNRSKGDTGPFWNERFGSTIIEESANPEDYLLWLLWYIGYNPVRKGLSRNPRNTDIGFINFYLMTDTKVDLKITKHQYFLDLGKTDSERINKFLIYEDIYLKRLAVYF